MMEITLLLVIATLVLFVIKWKIDRFEVDMLTAFLSVMAVLAILIDETVTDNWLLLTIVPMIFVCLVSIWKICRDSVKKL